VERVELDIKREVFVRRYAKSVPGMTRFDVKWAGRRKRLSSMTLGGNALIILCIINRCGDYWGQMKENMFFYVLVFVQRLVAVYSENFANCLDDCIASIVGELI
jgi:hypothetical protein